MDEQIEPKSGPDRVFAVPRVRKCTSSLYIDMLNEFGRANGIEKLIDLLRNASDEELDVSKILFCPSSCRYSLLHYQLSLLSLLHLPQEPSSGVWTHDHPTH